MNPEPRRSLRDRTHGVVKRVIVAEDENREDEHGRQGGATGAREVEQCNDCRACGNVIQEQAPPLGSEAVVLLVSISTCSLKSSRRHWSGETSISPGHALPAWRTAWPSGGRQSSELPGLVEAIGGTVHMVASDERP